MSFHHIDLEDWERREHFKHYWEQSPCTYSMTVELTVTKLRRAAKQQGIQWYPLVIYGISRIVNAHREFCMALDETEILGYFDLVNPSYTIFHPQTETFSTLWTEYHPDFSTFYQRYQSDFKMYGSNHTFAPKPAAGNNQFDISCIPWAHFTSFHLNIQKGYRHLAPIFTMGRLHEEKGQIFLPLAIQVHHAVCDGFHTARFITELQEWADCFTK